MKTEHKVVQETVLTLTPEEAAWLNGVMQNPLHGQSMELESAEDEEMRRRFFTATRSTHA